MSITFYVNADEDQDLQVAYIYALSLLGLLDVEVVYSGSIESSCLLKKIAAARKSVEARGWECPSSVSIGPKGAIGIDHGLSSERIMFYLDRLEEITRASQEAGISEVSWG